MPKTKPGGKRSTRKPPAVHAPRRPRVNTSTFLMTIQQVANELLLSERIIYRLIESGELQGFWPSKGRVYVHKEDFAAYVAARRGVKSEASK